MADNPQWPPGPAPTDAGPPPAGGSLVERVSDEERDRVVTLLRDHTVMGRLTLDEFSDRMGSALEARTRGDLAAVLADLPVEATPLPAAGRQVARRRFVAVMSGARAKGRWRAGTHTTAVAVMGGCQLDLRRAEIDGSELVITAWAVMGGVEIIVPEGIEVEMSGFAFMGGRSVRVADVPVVPGSPRIRIRAFPIMGSVSARSRRHRPAPDPALAGPGAVPALGASAHRSDAGRSSSRSRPSSRPRSRSNSSPGRPVAVDVGGASADPVGVPGPGEPVEGRDGTVTILFADMVGFSGLTERMGDRDLQQLLADYHRIVRAALADHGGREVKVQGDGFMIAFAGVGRALRCATAVFEALARRRDGDGGPPIDAHMGLHTGEAIEEGEDYVGHTVVVASRLADAAGPGEVLVSQLSALLVARTGEFRFGPARELTLKGLAAPQPVMALQWRSGPADDGPAEPSEAQGP